MCEMCDLEGVSGSVKGVWVVIRAWGEALSANGVGIRVRTETRNAVGGTGSSVGWHLKWLVYQAVESTRLVLLQHKKWSSTVSYLGLNALCCELLRGLQAVADLQYKR